MFETLLEDGKVKSMAIVGFIQKIILKQHTKAICPAEEIRFRFQMI